jgi:type II secretion system protein N
MRLPAVRLPSVRLPFDWFEGFGGRRTLLYALYTGVLFLVFLLANFPYNAIVQRVLKSVDLEAQGMRLDVGDGRFAWWHGYELQRVKLLSTDPDHPPFAEAASIYVRPGLDGLLRGRINSLYLLGLMYGGQVDGTVAVQDGVQRATVTFDRLQLQRYANAAGLLQLQDGSVAGDLSGVITIESRGGDASDTRAAAELELGRASLTDARLSNGITLPALTFDKATMKLSAQGGRLDVQELEASGPDLRLSASGQIALRQPLADSVLNIKLTALPGANSSDEVKTLLSLLPPLPKGSKPDAPHVISGTLARPRIR